MTAPANGQFCWNELATPNVKAAKEFYEKVLGWSYTESTMGDMTYTMIKAQGQEFGGMWQICDKDQANVPPHWLGYILVENLAKTLEHAEQLGAKVKMPITAAGTHGHFAVIQDPTGAHIAFWENSK